MLRKFRIKINEKEYLVEMEELGVPNQPAAPVAQAPATAPQQTPQQVAAPAPTPTSTPVQANGPGTNIEAPMPGNIIDVLVKVGDVVQLEQTLVILEAMKMESDLVAPKAGTVTAVHVTKGSAVDVGEVLVTIS
ncbi:acetyl-CoA carboxylase biotin carboxyl carrier protein subunit [Tissierella carlieri]|uniref:biotin/lipoyl-containing protein n=1 Tax=Tissierella carlieri TaxID=689904 RepID=UPI001C10323D|nr:biotin/lipoyl-containing protein [Tissierella carlieri]MBU5310976.1 acetyl-CoA carboxylase biotin carboxyl carrier protein subunit [Tissierella carlieri]